MSKANLGPSNQPPALANIYNTACHQGLAMSMVNGSTCMRKANVVDLTNQRTQVGNLVSCKSLGDISGKQETLFVDLSPCGMTLPIQDCNCIHLSFPSTLLRRPKFQFDQLTKTLDQDSQTTLASQIQRCNTFVFYDNYSTMQKCSVNTYQALTKIVPYLEKQKDTRTRYLLLQGGSMHIPEENYTTSVPNKLGGKSSECKSDGSNIQQQPTGHKNKHKLNLKIKIPSRNSKNENSNTMFVRSLKKDSVHYSPDSLRKYFTFHIPEAMATDDTVLPKWLKSFSRDGDKNLLRILGAFELLEKLEVQRLEKCLPSSVPIITTTLGAETSQKISSEARKQLMTKNIYSFRQLQREFRPNRHDYDSDNDSYHQAENLKLKMDIHEEIHDGENMEILSKLKHVNTDFISQASKNGLTASSTENDGSTAVENDQKGSCTDVDNEDEEVAETPLDDYLMTCGIQSFTKNRYSNILPYEHSRVKLEPSPVWPDCSGKLFVKKASSSVPSTSSSNALRKRRNSYFSQDFCPKELEPEGAEKQKESKPQIVTSTSRENGAPPKPISVESDSFNDYFNANYLKIPQINPDYNYIATQAPLPSTLDDFWKVVISNGVEVIISLNSDDELSMRKWDIYWNCKTLKKFDVQVEKSYDNVGGVKGCILRVFNVKRSSEESSSEEVNVSPEPQDTEKDKSGCLIMKRKKTRTVEEENVSSNEGSTKNNYTVYQLQYTKWLDSCGIVMSDVLKLHRMKNMLLKNPTAFIEDLEKGKTYGEIMERSLYSEVNLKTSPDDIDIDCQRSPVLVHCSAGCGRTGVFITLDFLLSVLERPFDKSNRIDVWNMSQDLIFIIVNELRKQRISMVQNLTQYITCYEGILEYFALRKSTRVDGLIC